MSIPVKIRTRKYLRDFLAFYYNTKEFTFEQDCEEHKFMRSLVTKAPIEREKNDPFFDTHIVLKIGDRNDERKILFVSNANAWRFYLRYHKLFKNHFISFVEGRSGKPGFKIDTSIKIYIENFGWSEDDIKFETLKKLYQREGTPKKIKTILTGTLPSVPLTVLF